MIRRLFAHADTAELFVIDRFSNGGFVSADRAVHVATNLNFPNGHVEHADLKQPTDQRFAFSEEILDGFRGLNHAYESRKDAENSPFGTRRNFAWRWRLGIQAAVARAILRLEHRGLSLEAK